MHLFLKLLFVGLLFSSQTVLANPVAKSAQLQAKPMLWQWQKSQCDDCEIKIVTMNPDLNTKKVQAYLRSLESSKKEILNIYQSDSQEYNLLALMAVGILGQESAFFQSTRYVIKENMQWAITIIKLARSVVDDGQSMDSNSRGPTQIKKIPTAIAEYYKIKANDLTDPAHAARATMGYLIMALKELKQRALNNNLTNITEETYVDYLPYIYFGQTQLLKNGSAQPERNIYVQNMKRYMRWVMIYEY